MALAHFRMLIHELLKKDPEIVTEEAHMIVLDSKSAVCMANNGKDSKHTNSQQFGNSDRKLFIVR